MLCYLIFADEEPHENNLKYELLTPVFLAAGYLQISCS